MLSCRSRKHPLLKGDTVQGIMGDGGRDNLGLPQVMEKSPNQVGGSEYLAGRKQKWGTVSVCHTETA